MKQHKFLKIMLAIVMMFCMSFCVVACDNPSDGAGSETSGEQPSEGGEPGETGSGEIFTNGVSAKMVVNESLAKLENTMGSMSSVASQSSEQIKQNAICVPKPSMSNYTSKSQILKGLHDIFQGQYQMQYFVNYANIAGGYLSDVELDKVYRTDYYGFDQFYQVKQAENGVEFTNEIVVDTTETDAPQKMYVIYQYKFFYTYDYQNKKPLGMAMYLRQYNKIFMSNSFIEDTGVYGLNIDLQSKQVDYLKLITNCTDGGAEFLNKLDNNMFDSATFEEDTNIRAYFVSRLTLDSSNNDFYVYNHGEGSVGGAEVDIDDTFRTRYDEVYSVVKNMMHTKSLMNTTDAVDMGDKLYINMYTYAYQVINCMSVDDAGNLTIRAIRDLSTIKKICAQIQKQLNEDEKYNSTTGLTYNTARQKIASAIEYLDGLTDANWLGVFDNENKMQLTYFDDWGCYIIKYENNNASGIAFELDENNNATLFEKVVDGLVRRTTADNE